MTHAICPNCHREIHYGVDGSSVNHRLEQYLSEREARVPSETADPQK
jgi:predicted HNH restriction endonuclease